MPRSPRTKSESGYMHLITRGISKQILFADRDDFRLFLSLLERYSRETEVTVCCYCLMDNHVHLLVYDPSGNVSLFMQKLNGSYSAYFNEKYDRSGHLFQDRFKSENIESENYLLTVFRYIMNNPQKAGICRASDYEWSSYRLYDRPDSFVRTGPFSELIGTREEYEAYIAAKNDDECMEYGSERHDDQWALREIRKTIGTENVMELQSWPREKRNAAIRMLKEKGLKIRQIERLTGINRGMIQKA